MNKLLKDAIADAKAVRETALANAKLALVETFQPKLQSMLSKKIKEEAEDEEEEEEVEETARYRKLANISEDDEEMEAEEEVEDEEAAEVEAEEEVEMEEEGVEGDEVEAEAEVEDEEAEEDLDLEAIIRELEAEEEAEEEEEVEMEEEGTYAETEEPEMEEEAEEEEEIDVNELIKSLREEDEEAEVEDEKLEAEDEECVEEGKMKKTKVNKMKEDLDEAYGVIKYLKSKINEVNLLNAKLLYVNKIFRNKNLSESQKVKVIETFDRAKSVRETKLIYTTVAESLVLAESKAPNKKRIVENFASTLVKRTNNPIIEADPVVARFKKLAGITKNQN